MSCLQINMPDNEGIANLMPENIYQTINGTGEGANNVVFNLDQVNNLVSNGSASDISNGYGATVSELKGGDTIGIGNHGGEWDGKIGSENGTARLSPSRSTVADRWMPSDRASSSVRTSS